MELDRHVGVVETRPPAQPVGEIDEHVLPGPDRLVALHLRSRLLDVAEVGQEDALVTRHHAGAVRACEAGQVADVHEIRDEQAVELALVEQSDQPVGARLHSRRGRNAHVLRLSFSIARASR